MAAQPSSAQKYGTLTAIFSTTALVLLFISFLRCNFIKFTDTSGTSEPIDLQFGIWYFMYWSVVRTIDGSYIFETCHIYGDAIEIDGSWKAARAFSVLASILGFFILVWSCVSACGDYRLGASAWEGPMYLMTATCTGLTLLLLNSNVCNSNILVQVQDASLENITFPETCSLATGAKLAISSTVFFFVSSVTSFLGYKASNTAGENADLNEPLNP